MYQSVLKDQVIILLGKVHWVVTASRDHSTDHNQTQCDEEKNWKYECLNQR